MADIFAGGTFERLPSPKAAAAIPFFEFAPRPPLVTLATLARYAKQLPAKRASIALVCPRETWLTPKGAMRPGAELDAGLDWIKRASDILKATAIVIATGRELTTGERDRSLLSGFAERLKGTGRMIVVAPRGLWEPEHGDEFARQTGTIYGFDPLESDAPEGDILYARVQPMGARPRLTEGHLAQIAERLIAPQPQQAFAAIHSEQAFKDAKRLALLLAEVLENYVPPEEDDEDDDSEEDEEDDEDDDSEEDGEALEDEGEDETDD